VTARVDGLPAPPEKKLALLLGQPVDATFVVGASTGAGAASTLHVRADVDEAVIRLDGAEVGRGEWSGNVTPGAHALEVSAPGRRTARIDVTVPTDAAIDYPVSLAKEGEAPGAYEHVDRKAAREKRLYIVPMIGGHGASYRLSAALAEPPSGTRRGFGGALFAVRGGVKVAKWLAIELHAEAGSLEANYRLSSLDVLDSTTIVRHFQLTPMLRLATPGKVRFTAGTGAGARSASIDASLVDRGSKVPRSGQGWGLSWLLDAGIQVDTGPVFLEGVLFADVHGVAAVEDAAGARLLQSSPGARLGLRVGLGIPF
jgi:hypothetical protein